MEKESKKIRKDNEFPEEKPGLFEREAAEIADTEVEDVSELKEELAAEVLVDRDAVERVMRQINDAELTDRLASYETLNEGEREYLAQKIENKGWFGILNSLSEGDRVAYFNAPGGELAIKKLNDIYFGNQITDAIWEKRNALLKFEMEKFGAQVLTADYKKGIFKLDGLSTTDLNQVSEVVDKEMTKYIISEIDKKESELERNSTEEDAEVQAAKQRLKELKEKLEKFGFVMSYGVGEVGSSTDELDKSEAALAVAHAAEAAQLTSRPRKPGEYGREFNESFLNEELGEIYGENGLAEKIFSEHNTIKTWTGESYEVFSQNENGFFVLNKDVARAVRKNKIVPAGESDELSLQKVSEYMRRINLIDLIRPNTAQELSGEEKLPSGLSLAEEAKSAKKIAEKLRLNDLNEDETKQATEFLCSDNKDVRFNSWDVFHAESVKIKDCAYVSLDVLDLGVDLVLGYEQAMQQMRGADEKTQKEIILSAGDDMTERMRDVRGTVLSVYEKHFNEKPTMLVGGDEVTLALSDRDGIDEFMLDLREETGSRVVKTVTASTERHSDKEFSLDDKDEAEKAVAEHLGALKRVELGVHFAKETEEAIRKLEKEAQDSGIDPETVGQMILETGLVGLIIKEKANGGFEAVSRADGGTKSMPAAEAVRVLEALHTRLTQT